MATLFITDLDGTLLGPDSRVSRKSAEIISRLSREGALISVATARTPATVEPLLASTYTSIPAVVMTGASLWDRTEHRFVEPRLFPEGMGGVVARRMTECGVNPFVYTLTSEGRLRVFHHGAPLTRHEDQFYQERRGLELKRFVLNHSVGYDGMFENVILLLGIGETPSVGATAELLRCDTALSVSSFPDIFNPAVSYIEVFSTGVSKAEAVLRLKALTRADRLVVYGDNLNDLSMMEVADEAVAVANARPEVKDAAARVIGPNSADAVALDMETLFRGDR